MKTTRVRTELMIEGERIEPEIVTKKLEMTPDIIHKKGEMLKNNRMRKNGSWGIKQEFEESYDISIQLNKLIELVKGKEDKIREIKEYYDGIIIVSVVIEVENSEVPGIVIENRISALMAKLGAEIDIDIYLLS